VSSKSRQKALSATLSYLVLFLSLIFFILPTVWIIYTSFRTQTAIFSGDVWTTPGELTLEHYTTILSVTDFPRYFLNTIVIATSVTVVSLAISILGAYGLSRFEIRGKNVLIMSIFATQMFPQVLLIIPLYLVVVSLLMLDTVPGVVAGQIILVLPFQVWMLTGYFNSIPREIDDSASIDGCNIAQRLIYIVIPIAAPGIAVAAFFSFVVSWGDYLIVSIISQSQRTATVTLVIQRLSASLLVKWGQVAAAVVLAIVPTILLFAFVQARLVEGLTGGAVKGE
jgi:ABC-type glycerol-3-phosphate transport system permease component